MKIVRDSKKKPIIMPLCDVPVGHIFKFKNIKTPMLRLSKGCGYCELGEAWDSVVRLDMVHVDANREIVSVYGEILSLEIKREKA